MLGLIDGLICSANQFGALRPSCPRVAIPALIVTFFWSAFYPGACDGFTDLLGHGASMRSWVL